MKQFSKSIQVLFLISGFEMLLAAGYLISVPASAGSDGVPVLGFSGMRFATLVLLAILFILFTTSWAAIRYQMKIGQKLETRLFQFFERKSIYNLGSISILGIILSAYLLFKWLGLEPSYEYSITLPRLLPLGFLSLILFLQLYFVVIYPKAGLKRFRLEQIENWVRSDIPARRIAMDLFITAVLLVLLSIGFQAIKYFTPYFHYLDFLIVEFFLDSEWNIPTYFSGLLLFFSAFLLFIKAKDEQAKKGKFTFQWYLLSLIFVYLSADEVLVIHEQLTEPVRNLLHPSGAFYFAWYIPVIPVLVLVGFYYLRFVLALPVRYKTGYIVSGTLYLLGVIGIEMIGSMFAQGSGLGNYSYTLVAALEELVEMTGIILFIYFNWNLVHLPLKTKQNHKNKGGKHAQRIGNQKP
jgi:hypothetical protein